MQIDSWPKYCVLINVNVMQATVTIVISNVKITHVAVFWLSHISFGSRIIIPLEARFRPNIGFTFERALTVFTRSDITPPKVNRFG